MIITIIIFLPFNKEVLLRVIIFWENDSLYFFNYLRLLFLEKWIFSFSRNLLFDFRSFVFELIGAFCFAFPMTIQFWWDWRRWKTLWSLMIGRTSAMFYWIIMISFYEQKKTETWIMYQAKSKTSEKVREEYIEFNPIYQTCFQNQELLNLIFLLIYHFI